jgi:hypothetical protein
VPNLLQYVGSGNYYGRMKVRGKVIRESLKTTVWSTAKLRLADFLKRQHEASAVVPAPTCREAVEHFKAASTATTPSSRAAGNTACYVSTKSPQLGTDRQPAALLGSVEHALQNLGVHLGIRQVVEGLHGMERVRDTAVGVEHALMQLTVVRTEIDPFALGTYFLTGFIQLEFNAKAQRHKDAIQKQG